MSESVRRRSPSPTGETVLTVDVARWPIVVLTYAGKPSLPQLANHLRELEEKVLSRKERFVQIIDQTQGEIPDAMQRALIAEHQSKMEELYEQYCVGEVYVCTSRMRSAMIAVFWRAKPQYAYTFVDTFAEAARWARQRWYEATGPTNG